MRDTSDQTAGGLRRTALVSICLLCATASVLLVFRHLIISDFDRVSGDIGDARITMVLLEHWREAFLGKRAWTSPIFFYPSPGVLGYTDAYFLFAPFFSLFRTFGFDIYLSYDFTLAAIKVIGFGAMAWMLRRTLLLPHWAAILGAILFTILSSFAAQLAHAQLLTIALVPIVIVAAVDFFRYLESQPARALLSGAIAAVMLPLILLTSFYTGWFFVLFSFCLAALFLLRFGSQALAYGPQLLTLARSRVLLIGAIGAILAVSTVPFLALYLPKLSETGGHSFAALLPNSPNLLDIAHLDSSNLIWGSLSNRFFAAVYAGKPINGEIITGFAPVLLILFAAAIIMAIRGCRGLPMSARSVQDHFVIFAGLSAILLWLMSVRVDDFSLWWVIYKFFPGGSAMRVPGRLPLFLSVFVVPIAVIGVVRLSRMKTLLRWHGFGSATLSLVLTIAISVALVVEEINRPSYAGISRSQEDAVFGRIQPPPPSCKMFYVEKAAPRDEPWDILRNVYGPNLDAVIVAQRFNLPTFNGMSTWIPKGWDLSRPGTESYERSVDSWIKMHGLSDGICRLDLAAGTWSLHDDRAESR